MRKIKSIHLDLSKWRIKARKNGSPYLSQEEVSGRHYLKNLDSFGQLTREGPGGGRRFQSKDDLSSGEKTHLEMK